MTPRNVLVTGGTGFIGGHVIRTLRARGTNAWVWARDVAAARAKLPGTHVVGALDDIPAAESIDAIVNLAGAPVIGPPWTDARRRVLMDSRIETTAAVLAWCRGRAIRPSAILTASAIGFYGPGGDDWFDETSPPQDRFQCRLCIAREAATKPFAELGMRVVDLRIGLVLGADGGILSRLALAARLGGAAVLGDGRQWMSWIHIEDLLRSIDFALADDSIVGPVNLVGPDPVRQRDFQRALTRTLHRPLLLRVPAFALNFALGEMAELLVRGQRVRPRRLQESGFDFAHPALEPALTALLSSTGAAARP
jgi:uncharacterized protein (TIGR01777 family)